MKTQTMTNMNAVHAFILSARRVFIIGLSAVSIAAQSQDLVTLNDAVTKSLRQHPELASFTFKKQVSEGLVEQAKVTSPLLINATVEDALGTGKYSGVTSLQTTLGISWLLEDEVINARVNVANQQIQVSQFEKQVKAIDIAAETAEIFITILSQQELLRLAEINKKYAKNVLKDIATRVNAGKVNRIDQFRAKADLAKKALVVEDLEHEIEAAIEQLSAQWQGDSDFSVVGTLAIIPTIETLDHAYEKLTSNPKLQLFFSEQRIAESEIALAKVTQQPSWTVNAGIRRNEAVDDFAFTAGITIPLGNNTRNSGQISSLQARKNQSTVESEAWFKRLSTQLLLLTHKLKHNRHVIEGLSTEVIPSLNQASSNARDAYKRGRYSYTDLYAVQQELVASQIELVQAYTNIHLLNIELERLTGSSIYL